MAERGRRCSDSPYQIGPRLALLLDLALVSGRPPLRLLDEGSPDTWSDVDLEIVSQWRHLQDVKCPGCGRPLAQHLHNPQLNREEVTTDYIPYSVDCPATQALAEGQQVWKTFNQSAIDAYHAGNAPDPGMGLYWIAQGPGESLPSPEVM